MNPEEQVIEILKENGIETILSVPCAKIKNLLILASREFKHIPLTREEEGIGIATGAFLAGNHRSAMMMQSGGIGNSINALLSLAVLHKIPIPILISWRGIYKETITAQYPMGQHLTRLFEAADIPYVEIHEEDHLSNLNRALQSAFEHSTPYGILFSPKVWENSKSRQFKIEYKSRDRTTKLHYEKTIQHPTLKRIEILRGLQEYLSGKIVVSNIGFPSKELYAVCDQESNFYMTGSFGLVSLIGLGIALNVSQEVIVIDGDGSILTNPNALSTIAQESPENLTILAIDNGTHGSTGNQITPAYDQIDLEALAQGFGIQETSIAYTSEEIINKVQGSKRGPKFIHIITKPANASVKAIPLNPLQIKDRFQKFIKAHVKPK